jgi:hypothetical protein
MLQVIILACEYAPRDKSKNEKIKSNFLFMFKNLGLSTDEIIGRFSITLVVKSTLQEYGFSKSITLR